jgi:HAD superfamily hydrolase (TIGR01509 family)
VKKKIYEIFPDLYVQEPNWNILYEEKKKTVLQLIAREGAPLLSGVQEVLRILEKKGKKRCVVTHSLQELVSLIRERNPSLQSIPHWITREQYNRPKPFPDSYLKAVELYGAPKDRIIGFEDTVRGWNALQSASIQGIVISSVLGEEFHSYLVSKNVPIYSSFLDLLRIEHLN